MSIIYSSARDILVRKVSSLEINKISIENDLDITLEEERDAIKEIDKEIEALKIAIDALEEKINRVRSRE